MRIPFKAPDIASSDLKIILCTCIAFAVIVDAVDYAFNLTAWLFRLLAVVASIYVFATALKMTQSRRRLVAFIILQAAVGAIISMAYGPFPNSPLAICIPAMLVPAVVVTPTQRRPLLIALFFLTLLIDFEYFLFAAIRIIDPALTVPTMAQAIAQTNLREAIDYMMANGLPIIGLALVSAISMLYAKIRIRRKTAANFAAKRTYWTIILALFGCGLLISSGPAAELYQVAQRHQGDIQHWRDMKATRDAKIDSKLRSDHCCDTHVVIVGESTNRLHMQAYGYPLDTTPNISASIGSPDFVLFSDTISPDVMTMPSLKKVLTNSTNDHPIDFSHSISIIQELKGAGYETTWISNQSRMGIADNEVGVIASDANHQNFINSNFGVMANKPDQALLPLFSNAISAPTSRNRVIFLHLMGCHAPYKDRIAKDFARKFQGLPTIPSISNEITNIYDNAEFNNDLVIGHIVEIAKANHAASILYFSDHGEDVEFGGEHDPSRYRKTMAEIPLMLWTSKEYTITHRQLVSTARENANRPFMTDGLFNTMLDLYDISAPEYDATRSIVNPRFQERQRWTMGGAKKYDEQPTTRALPPKSADKNTEAHST